MFDENADVTSEQGSCEEQVLPAASMSTIATVKARLIRIALRSQRCRAKYTYSAIHKAAGSLVTGRSLQNCKKIPFRDHSPIHGFTDFQELYQSNHGMVGYREAGGFVNSAAFPNTVRCDKVTNGGGGGGLKGISSPQVIKKHSCFSPGILAGRWIRYYISQTSCNLASRSCFRPANAHKLVSEGITSIEG